ncbi:NUDIX hydrolase [Patescibacteria group bacterium]|nr:MAG: NUDIX hydrolase [Patescibacteria group bacterium]
MHEPWKVESTETAFQNRWWHIRKDVVRLPDGSSYEYFVNDGVDGVVVVPVAADGRFMIQRIYKHGVRQAVLEFPMGRMEKGEAPEQTAARELKEETGFAADLELLGAYWIFPTSSSNRITLFLGRNATKAGEAENDPKEQAELIWVTADELRGMLERGELASLLQMGAGYRALEALGV